MPEPTAEFSHWLSPDPTARNGLIIAAWQATGSARRYLAGIADERLRDMVRDVLVTNTRDFVLVGKDFVGPNINAVNLRSLASARGRMSDRDRQQLEPR